MAKGKINNNVSLEKLKILIEKEKHYVIKPFRPTFDEYFMKIAFTLKMRSNCMKRR